jgi:hypothetical protein
MTSDAVRRFQCGRSTFMHLPSRQAGFDARLASLTVRFGIISVTERGYGAKLVP